MSELSNQMKNVVEMSVSKKKQKEFNDRMYNITSRYQKIYNFKINKNDPKHLAWNNEADAFKHTFGSALMAFELGHAGSVLGGLQHEIAQKNNPKGEENMDSWNNFEGRKIANEIKKEYGEKKFRNFSQKKQEDIIAHKVMVKMKNGDLITHPSDKRIYRNWFAKGINKNIEGFKENTFQTRQNKQKATGTPTGFISPLSGTNSIANNNQNNFAKKEPSKLMHIGGIAVDTDNVSIYGKKWKDMADEDKKAFFEGLKTGAITKEGEKRAKLREENWTKKFNIGNPETDKGHWITLDNGKHLFIKDR